MSSVGLGRPFEQRRRQLATARRMNGCMYGRKDARIDDTVLQYRGDPSHGVAHFNVSDQQTGCHAGMK
jgi:hypothetical protein